MKKIALVLLSLLMIVTLFSCKKDKSDAPDGMFYEANDAVDYQIFFPEGWSIDRNDGMVSAHVSDSDSSNVSVTAFALPREYTTLDDYLDKEYLDYFSKNFSDMNVIEEFSEIEFAGNDARRLVFSATVGGNSYQFMQIVTLHYDGYLYILTYTSTPGAYNSHMEDVEKIISEFKFL